MLDIGATELLLIVVVAVVVIGPKDLPLALRTAGKWIGQMRRLSNHFRAGLDAMIRESEMAEMEKKWRDQNEKIMQAQAGGATAETAALPDATAPAAPPVQAEPIMSDPAEAPPAPAEPAVIAPPPVPAPATAEPAHSPALAEEPRA
ncbi:Sec-independent protein translocase protein TatB [Croceibacterium mercuriale]|uniref:Sec-independent protein translocase protein TatB n=1 Tax=Croceibacterium mercuriale TaxID=1572751 RepID=UPI0006892DE8|nr:Sec-independent protein translocase protein TatB [Croceibacterium mercuriale]